MTFTFQKRVKLGLSNRQPVPRLTDPGFLLRGTAFSVSVSVFLAISSLRAAHDGIDQERTISSAHRLLDVREVEPGSPAGSSPSPTGPRGRASCPAPRARAGPPSAPACPSCRRARSRGRRRGGTGGGRGRWGHLDGAWPRHYLGDSPAIERSLMSSTRSIGCFMSATRIGSASPLGFADFPGSSADVTATNDVSYISSSNVDRYRTHPTIIATYSPPCLA